MYVLHDVSNAVDDGLASSLEHAVRGVTVRLPLAVETISMVVGEVSKQLDPNLLGDCELRLDVGCNGDGWQQALVEKVEDGLVVRVDG